MKFIHILWATLSILPLSANAATPSSPARGEGGKAFSSHLCQLLVSDGETVMPLTAYARRVVQPTDSLTSEQIFAELLLRDANWQSLRFFPHRQDDGTVTWYAPADDLPASLDTEHQKYIREVFPRLVAVVQAQDWATANAYIDRMVQYQCLFGGSKQDAQPQPIALATIALLLFALLGLRRIYP